MQTGSVDGGGSGGAEGLPGATATAGQPSDQGQSPGWVFHTCNFNHSGTSGRFKQMPAYSVSRKLPEESVHMFTGHFLWEKTCLEEICVSRDLNEALTEGLTALTRQEEVGITVREHDRTRAKQMRRSKVNHVLSHLQSRPLEFLAHFLTRWREEKDGEESVESESVAPLSSQKCLSRTPELPQVCALSI